MLTRRDFVELAKDQSELLLKAVSGVLDDVTDNIQNLGDFFPGAQEIAQADIDPYEEGGEFDWLLEGYQDTVTY